MIRLVDEALRVHFDHPAGLASPDVTVADPATGTGTFLLGILRRIAANIEDEQGPGAVPQAIETATARLIGFEMQLGPFAVAQLRVLAELRQLIGKTPRAAPRMFVTDTLGEPTIEVETLGSLYSRISESRRQANQIKRTDPITVVIGNPPYKEKARGRGGWVENGKDGTGQGAPLNRWLPPTAWGVGAHAKHLRNLYIYFWRWATWKVFDQNPGHDTGIVCFITVAGFLNGPGFQKMREDLRQMADRIWIVDCSPEGHQPDVPNRIFQAVQQPVCIVMVARSKRKAVGTPAEVRYTALPSGKRQNKFEALAGLTLESTVWHACPSDGRAPFLPTSTGEWTTYPALDQLFAYNGSGIMPGRTWVIAPDAESLRDRWRKLIKAKPELKQDLFVPHLNQGKLGDRHMDRIVKRGLPGFADAPLSLSQESGEVMPPVRYGFRSFDRQWIIPDNRLLNRPNPELWRSHGDQQIYLTALMAHSPTSGPSISFTALIPDLHHYKGSFGGRVFPLWRDSDATEANLPPKLLGVLSKAYGTTVTPEDFLAYLGAVAANPAYTSRFQADLIQPGLRIPLTTRPDLFRQAVALGRTVIWLHTFGERYVDAKDGRPFGPPRLPKGDAPRIPAGGAIPDTPDAMPDEIRHDESTQRLYIGDGFIDSVPSEVWRYEVSGKRVLTQWFSYRRRNRERPIIGDRRPPSPLGEIGPGRWLSEYTTELLNVLHVLGLLVGLEPAQATLLEAICEGPSLVLGG